jgi:hypothetical protein
VNLGVSKVNIKAGGLGLPYMTSKNHWICKLVQASVNLDFSWASVKSSPILHHK